jgi:hypothetical protein
MVNFSADMETWGRLSAIAEKKGRSLEELIPEMLERGIASLEQLPASSPVEKVGRPRGAKAQKQQFIREHYKSMTDDEMAQALDASPKTITLYRYELGLKHKKVPTMDNSPEQATSLTEVHKAFVKDNLSLSNLEIARKFGVKKKLVAEYRRSLLRTYLQGEGKDAKVAATAVMYGMHPVEVSHLRSSLGLARPDVKTNYDLSALGSRENILFALTRGGKTTMDLIREFNLSVSREGFRQILIKRFGITGAEDRTYEWHARRMARGKEELFQKLVDKPALEAKLSTTPITVVAAELGVDIRPLDLYLKNHLHLDVSVALSNKRMTELVCSNPECDKPEGKFFRPTRSVKKDREKNPGKSVFCSKKCFGQVIGRTIGFVAHPENARIRHSQKKS